MFPRRFINRSTRGIMSIYCSDIACLTSTTTFRTQDELSNHRRLLHQQNTSKERTWKAPESQPLPASLGKHVSIDAASIPSNYPLCISAVVPRPIAFISSCGGSGGDNLAPFSYFGMMGHDPPTISIGITRKGGDKEVPKDTLANILETKEFVVNMMSEWFLDAANHTCGDYDSDVSEWELSGLTKLQSTKVTPPRCAESAVHMECVLEHSYDTINDKGIKTVTVVVGRIVQWHIAEGLLDNTHSSPSVRLQGYLPVGRLGGNDYALIQTDNVLTIPRPPKSAQDTIKPST